MAEKHWTSTRIIAVIIASIGVIAAFVNWLISFEYLYELVPENTLWTITMTFFAITSVIIIHENNDDIEDK